MIWIAGFFLTTEKNWKNTHDDNTVLLHFLSAKVAITAIKQVQFEDIN